MFIGPVEVVMIRFSPSISPKISFDQSVFTILVVAAPLTAMPSDSFEARRDDIDLAACLPRPTDRASRLINPVKE